MGALIAQAAGAVNAVAVSYIVYMVLVVGGAAIAIRWGVGGVAASTALAITVVAAECMFLAMRVSGMRVREMVKAHAPGLTMAAIVAAVAWPSAVAMRAAALSDAAVLAAGMAVSVLACLLLLAWFLRTPRGDFAWLRTEIARLRGQKATKLVQ
jgi:hypothetical protein